MYRHSLTDRRLLVEVKDVENYFERIAALGESWFRLREQRYGDAGCDGRNLFRDRGWFRRQRRDDRIGRQRRRREWNGHGSSR
jgi:hypothetical protein